MAQSTYNVAAIYSELKEFEKSLQKLKEAKSMIESIYGKENDNEFYEFLIDLESSIEG